MPKPLYILLLLFIAVLPAKAQQGFNLLHNFCTDGDTQSVGFSCYADSSRYFVSGVTRTKNVLPMHGYLASFDYIGKELWTRKLLVAGKENSSSTYMGIAKTAPGEFVYTGTIIDRAINPSYVIYQPFFYFFNSNGDSLAYREYIDSFCTRTINALLVDGDHIITAGSKSSPDHQQYTLWLCKYDKSGNLVWERNYLHYITAGVPVPTRIALSADKQHYLFAGSMFDSVTYQTGSCMIQTDTSGNVTWIKSLKKPFLSWNEMDVVSNPSGGYYFISSCSKKPDVSGIPNTSRVYYGKLNEQGDTLWTRTFSDSLYNCMGYQLEWSNDGQHLLLKAANGYEVPALIKIDTSGNIAWYHLIQHVYLWNQQYLLPSQVLRSLSVTPGERYLLAGTIEGGHVPGVFDMNGVISWMVLTDSSGCRYPGDPSCWPVSVPGNLSTDNVPSTYPNPSSGYFTFETPQTGCLYLYNIQGREIARYTIEKNKTQLHFPAQQPPGTYIGRFVSAEAHSAILRISYQP